MKKTTKKQADEDFDMMLKKFIDEDFDSSDDWEDTTFDDDDDEEENLPFPKEMKDKVADVMIRNHYSLRKCMDDISSVEMELLADHNFFSDATMVVTFKGKPKASLRQQRFSCYFYTDDCIPICEGSDVTNIKYGNSRQIKVEIPCHQIWIPGRYFLIVRDNEDSSSIMRIDFILDDRLMISQGDWKRCRVMSMEDMLTSCLTSENDNWSNISRMPGSFQIRQSVLLALQVLFYNECRKESCGEIKTCMNRLICMKNPSSDFLARLHILMAPDYSFRYVDSSTLFDITRTNPYEMLHEVLNEITNMKLFCLTRLNELTGASGKVIMRKFIDIIQKSYGKTLLWLCGTRQEIDNVMALYPSLKQFFNEDSWLEQKPSNAYEMVQAFFNVFAEENLTPNMHVKNRLSRTIIQGVEQGKLSDWTIDEVHQFIEAEIIPQYFKHLISNTDTDYASLLQEEDIPFDKLIDTSSTYEESITGLREMIGLDDVKQGINTMANQARLFIERRRRGLKSDNHQIYHSIFTGNPGTGKTTVARQLGKIFHSLGLLSKGEVIAVDRTRLVGQYIGQTEENMKAILEEAKGNVLFIDEAYTLYTGSDDNKDFGRRVLDSLLTVLTQPNSDMLIIFAGYTKQMDVMLNSNPGLASRFPFRYYFDDYSSEQLMEIAMRLFKREEYTLTKEAMSEMEKTISEAVRLKSANFGNARWVEQFVHNGIIPAMANRIFSTGSNDFQSIDASDIRKAFEKYNPKVTELKPRHYVTGFSV